MGEQRFGELVHAVLGIPLAERELGLFARLAADLAEAGRQVNLTAILDREGIERKHFLDSLSLLAVEEIGEGERVVDIGSGAGFPGLPLAIHRPDLRLDLLEATRKKAAFLEREVRALGLAGVRVLPLRSEDWARGEGAAAYDLAVARAVAPLERLLPLAWPLVRPGGRLVAYKGPKAVEEIASARRVAERLGTAAEVRVLRLPGVGERYLVRFHRPPEGPARGIWGAASKSPQTALRKKKD